MSVSPTQKYTNQENVCTVEPKILFWLIPMVAWDVSGYLFQFHRINQNTHCAFFPAHSH